MTHYIYEMKRLMVKEASRFQFIKDRSATCIYFDNMLVITIMLSGCSLAYDKAGEHTHEEVAEMLKMKDYVEAMKIRKMYKDNK